MFEVMLVFFILLGQVFLYLYKKRKVLTTLSFAFFLSNLIYANYEEIRYKTKYDKNGSKYTKDLLTGKQWKTISTY